MKIEYEIPEVEIIRVESSESVLQTSGGDNPWGGEGD